MALHGPLTTTADRRILDREGRAVSTKEVVVALNRFGAQLVGGDGHWSMYTGVQAEVNEVDEEQKPRATWHELTTHPRQQQNPAWESNSPCGIRAVVSRSYPSAPEGKGYGFGISLDIGTYYPRQVASGGSWLWSADRAKVEAEKVVELLLKDGNLSICWGGSSGTPQG